MTLFAVLFEDVVEGAEEIRRRHLPAHLDFLQHNAGAIQAAGPLRGAEGAPAGGLWLVEAEAPEVVQRLVRDDPFWPAGLRRSVLVLTWARVFADGQLRRP